MASAPEAPREQPRLTDRQQWLAILRTRWGRAAAVLALVVAVVVVAGGGLRRATSLPGVEYPVAKAGQRITTGAFAITPQRAWLAETVPGGYPKAGKRYLVLRVTAENLTQEGFAAASLLVQDVVWLPDGRANERKGEPLHRADDHSLAVELQPGLPVLLDMVWELEAGTPVQQPVRWGVYARDYVERAYLQGDSGWRQGQPHSKIELQPGPPPAEAG